MPEFSSAKLAPTSVMLAIEERRENLVNQLMDRQIRDPKVLDAFRKVPREEFVPERLSRLAYHDEPLPIGEGQTISQPYIVALTVESLKLTGDERVLEIGTGSGYEAAILGELAAEVYTVERLPSLATTATERLARLGYDNVHVHYGDGSLGWAEHAPYDAIAVSAGAPRVPLALLRQLGPRGRLVIPVGVDQSHQVLIRVTRRGDTFNEEALCPVRFVPLIGEEAWRD